MQNCEVVAHVHSTIYLSLHGIPTMASAAGAPLKISPSET